MRRFFTYSTAVLLIIAFSPLSQVLAKDLCVEDNNGSIFIFKNVKPLKNPGQFSPLDGIWIAPTGSNSGPFHGAAYVRHNGTIDMGFFVHNNLVGANWTAQLRGSTFETASGVSQDEGGPTVSMTFVSPVDCKSISLP